MANSRFYSSIAATTTLQVTAAPSDTSIQVASSVGFPGSFPFTLSLDYGAANEELVDVTAGGPSIYTVTRAVDGTSASTHNAGAVVRHVSSARDFTDSRTHEAAVSGVHGVTGTFVDTSSAQTLTNKTLTSPTISTPAVSGGTFSGAPTFSGTPNLNAGGALSGTFSGTPTFSGNTTFSAGATIAGGALSGTFSGSPTMSGNITFSASPLFSGSPNFTGVTTFTAATNFDGLVNADAQVLAQRTFATGATYRTSVTGDANDRFFIEAGGGMNWGPGTAAVDTNLYRSAANTLKTDDALVVAGDLDVQATTWTTFTPTWTVGGSPPTTTNVGWHKKVGKIVFFEIYTVWGNLGSGSTTVQGNLPSVPFRDGNGPNTTRQFVSGWISGLNTVGGGMCFGQILAGGSGTAFALNRYDDLDIESGEIQNNTIATIQGWYREA